MRRILILLLGIALAIGGLSVQPVSAAESDDLYAAINQYRLGLDLTAIPLSPQLTAVAQAHVRDLSANFATDPNYTGADCIPHGWSSNGQWTGGCYKDADPTTFQIMWSKPGEISNYPGNGFEILFGNGVGTATAADALRAWQADGPHNDVIVNQGIWEDHPWLAVGVWVEDGWASVWFGEQADPNATQPGTAPNDQAAGTDGGDTGQANTDDGGRGNGNQTTNGNGTTNTGTGNGNAANDGNNQGAAALTACGDAEEFAFLALVNDHRAANGLGALTLSPALSAAAKAHSQDMAAKNYFDHVGQDGSTFSQRIIAAGYAGNPTAENIFAGDQSAAGAFASWVNSPPHNANMLSPNSLAIGIGRAFDAGSEWGWYWTTTFGDTADAACGRPNANGQTTNVSNEPAGDGTTNGNDPAADGTTNGDQPGADDTTNGNEPAGDGTTNGDKPADNGTNNGNEQGAAALPVCVDAEELAFLTLVNNYRAENGLGAFSLSPALSTAAKSHSQDMAAKNYFEHEGLDGSTFSQRIIAAGYTGNPTAENIFAGDQTAAGAFESWKNSPPHNANMLSPNSLAIGIGRAFDAGSGWGWYWTTTFGDTADAACGGPSPDGEAADGANGQDDQTGTGGNGGADTQPGNDANGTGDNGANTQPGNADPNADSDGDGLLDTDETGFFGTNPQAFDTDGGGVGDGDEFFNGTDPLNPNDDNGGNGNGAVDSDGDGITDADEVDFFGTDPQAFDTDGDGVSDGEEFFNGTDPLDPNSF